MDHKNIDNDTHDNINENDKKILESSKPQVETSQAEFFSDNTSQKIKQPRSVLVFLLTIASFIVLAILIFSYIYNLAGLRDFTYHYYSHKHVSEPIVEIEKFKQSSHNDDVSDSHLNASKQVQKIQNDIETQNKILEETQAISEQHEIAPSDTSLLEYQPDNQELENYQKKLNILHHNLKKISNQFLILNKKFAYGDPYLETLIDLKTQIKNQKINTPVLTEYASGGFPTDMIIVTDALKTLKKLALIESRQNSSNTFTNIINRFIVITPQSDTQGLSGVFHKMSKALYNGDFDTVSDLINGLSPKKQQAFNELQILISDKKAIYYELKKLNNAIIDDIFALPQHNNTDA